MSMCQSKGEMQSGIPDGARAGGYSSASLKLLAATPSRPNVKQILSLLNYYDNTNNLPFQFPHKESIVSMQQSLNL